MTPNKTSPFLSISQYDMRQKGMSQLDVILVTGDAYIDHPSFAAALVGRYIESIGLSVGIISMPDVKNAASVTALGAPRYFFGVTAGNVDSMLSLFTAQKKPRSDDPYVPGGMAGVRPARATIAYCNLIRQHFKNIPIIIGGVEASLRRIAHYDYWSDTIRQSILLDSKADLLVYGMGEHPLCDIVTRLKCGEAIKDMRGIPGTVCSLGKNDFEKLAAKNRTDIIRLPSYDEIKASKDCFNDMTRSFYEQQHKTLLQESGSRAILINQPAAPLACDEFDRIYELPFVYKPHPSYTQTIPAYEQIKDSVTVVRGCFGGCNFCGLGAHQGKTIQSRSQESILHEINKRSSLTGWKGIVSDLGGPTANMYGLFCKRPASIAHCARRSCLAPSVCSYLETNQSRFENLIHSVHDTATVKHAYVNSGIRMDLALLYPDIIRVIAQKATGGQLSVAPEHISRQVLAAMHKPENTGWEQFEDIFTKDGNKAGKEQYLVPYFIAGHPGSTLKDAQMLGSYLKSRGIKVRQVQEYIPVPMTVSCAMYYTGKDPFTGREVFVSHKLSDMRQQKETIMWWQKQDGSSHHTPLRTGKQS